MGANPRRSYTDRPNRDACKLAVQPLVVGFEQPGQSVGRGVRERDWQDGEIGSPFISW
jgi:hypothetical protein